MRRRFFVAATSSIMTLSSNYSNAPVERPEKDKKHRLEKEEKDCIMLYVLMNMGEVVGFIR